jgi:hypothetical protein
MRVEARANQAQHDEANAVTVDVSLRRAEPTGSAIPVDQIMVAVDSVRRYVVSHLSRIGRACDVDDVMQDVRVAVWDGVTRGHYRQLPGVPFGAWVQGVCANVCAAHIRRELSHQTFPLLVEPGDADGPASLDALAILGIGGVDRSAEKIIDQEWARKIIELTRASVPGGVWELAVDSLSGPRQYGPPSPQDRRRWHAATVVRQTARTVQNALEVEPTEIRNIGTSASVRQIACPRLCCAELRQLSFVPTYEDQSGLGLWWRWPLNLASRSATWLCRSASPEGCIKPPGGFSKVEGDLPVRSCPQPIILQ